MSVNMSAQIREFLPLCMCKHKKRKSVCVCISVSVYLHISEIAAGENVCMCMHVSSGEEEYVSSCMEIAEKISEESCANRGSFSLSPAHCGLLK